jgi:hypothetical protein
MNRSQITHFRLWNQQIAHPRLATAGEVVAALGAMQAQDYTGTCWAIGLRLPVATAATIEQAIADRTIIRTWPMRGTLHFVAAADVRWMLELLTPRVLAGSAGRLRQLDLDAATITRSGDVIARALEGGVQLSRSAIFDELARAGIATAGQRGYHILAQLGQQGLICFGVHEGKQPAFALLDAWAPHAKRLERDEALAELTARYFTSHGPAALQDFVHWSGLKISDAKTGLALAATRLAEAVIGGVTYWMAPSAPAASDAAIGVYLLPGFDEYLLGYRDRSAALDPQHAQRVIPGGNGVFHSTIVIDGRIAGVWKRTVKKNSLHITLEPFTPLSEIEQAGVAAAVERYGRFMELPVRLT